jgi:hypothetical protein
MDITFWDVWIVLVFLLLIMWLIKSPSSAEEDDDPDIDFEIGDTDVSSGDGGDSD